MNPLPITVIKISSIGFLAGMGVVLGFQLLTGSINTRGLVTDKVKGTFSPGRLQMIFFTFAAAFYYLYKTVEAQSFVPLDNELLVAIGSSSTVYLTGKTISVFRHLNKIQNLFNIIKK